MLGFGGKTLGGSMGKFLKLRGIGATILPGAKDSCSNIMGDVAGKMDWGSS